MKNLLIDPPGYSHVKPMMSEYPVGLLKLSSFLKHKGEEVDYFDFFPRKAFVCATTIVNKGDSFKRFYYGNNEENLRCYKAQPIAINRNDFYRNTGEYVSRLGSVFPRIYSGAEWHVFEEYLKNNRPDKIWVGSGISYYYNGTVEAINMCKRIYPEVPVVLGGIYPSLCPDHAKKFTKADVIVEGECEEFKNFPLDYDILPNRPEYLVSRFSRGCPNNCKFCAVSYLEGRVVKTIDVKKEVDEIARASKKHNLRKLKLFGSNMLIPEKGKIFEEWLDRIIATNISFEIICPEGFAPELLTKAMSKKIYQAGFAWISIPLDSGSDEGGMKKSMGKKYELEDWERAIREAGEAGFKKEQIRASVIYGMYGQTVADVMETVKILTKYGVRVVGNAYTPVPKSSWYENSDRFKELDMEYMDGELLPAVTNVKDFNDFCMASNLLTDTMLLGGNDRREDFLKQFDTEDKRKEGEMIGKEMIDKMATVLIDISEQNEVLSAETKKLIDVVCDLTKRVESLEAKK